MTESHHSLKRPIHLIALPGEQRAVSATVFAARGAAVTQDSRIRLAGYPDTRQTLSRVLESRRGVCGEVDETACRCLNTSGVQGDRVSQRPVWILEQPAPPTSPLRPLRTQDSRIRVALYLGTRQTLSRVLESRRGASGESAKMAWVSDQALRIPNDQCIRSASRLGTGGPHAQGRCSAPERLPDK